MKTRFFSRFAAAALSALLLSAALAEPRSTDACFLFPELTISSSGKLTDTGGKRLKAQLYIVKLFNMLFGDEK